jgi:hypothetical protein
VILHFMLPSDIERCRFIYKPISGQMSEDLCHFADYVSPRRPRYKINGGQRRDRSLSYLGKTKR